MMFPTAKFGELLACLEQDLQTEDGLWTLRGFVDIARLEETDETVDA
jgi:hypothetical protein